PQAAADGQVGGQIVLRVPVEHLIRRERPWSECAQRDGISCFSPAMALWERATHPRRPYLAGCWRCRGTTTSPAGRPGDPGRHLPRVALNRRRRFRQNVSATVPTQLRTAL